MSLVARSWSKTDNEISFGNCYMASFYWAILMTTGLNVPIGPGLRQGQIVYECVISFMGVCMQARTLAPPIAVLIAVRIAALAAVLTAVLTAGHHHGRLTAILDGLLSTANACLVSVTRR